MSKDIKVIHEEMKTELKNLENDYNKLVEASREQLKHYQTEVFNLRKEVNSLTLQTKGFMKLMEKLGEIK